MGNSHTKKIKKYNDSYSAPFSFEGKKFICKVLDVISNNKFKVVFIYNKRPSTWNVELIGCEDLEDNDKKDMAKILVENELRNSKYIAKIVCGQLINGYVNVVMFTKKKKNSINELLKRNNYAYNNDENDVYNIKDVVDPKSIVNNIVIENNLVTEIIEPNPNDNTSESMSFEMNLYKNNYGNKVVPFENSDNIKVIDIENDEHEENLYNSVKEDKFYSELNSVLKNIECN